MYKLVTEFHEYETMDDESKLKQIERRSGYLPPLAEDEFRESSFWSNSNATIKDVADDVNEDENKAYYDPEDYDYGDEKKGWFTHNSIVRSRKFRNQAVPTPENSDQHNDIRSAIKGYFYSYNNVPPGTYQPHDADWLVTTNNIKDLVLKTQPQLSRHDVNEHLVKEIYTEL